MRNRPEAGADQEEIMATKEKSTEKPEHKGQTKVGTVVSNAMQKTVVVAVENLVLHPMYRKYIKRTNKFMAHCEMTDVNVGDKVVIEETRPLSKRKRWNVREIVSRAS